MSALSAINQTGARRATTQVESAGMPRAPKRWRANAFPRRSLFRCARHARAFHRQCAFSLVEVTVALGVAAFCLIAIFGLLPVGIRINQTSIQQTIAANLASAIAADLRATPKATTAQPSPASPRYVLTIPSVAGAGNMQSLFFGEGSGAVSSNATPAPRTRATIFLTPPAAGKAATSGRIQFTWPALADPVAGTAPSKFSGSYEVFVALDRN